MQQPASALDRFDMHCHLDFAPDPRVLADELALRGIGCFSMTMDPAAYERACAALDGCANVRVGLGVHPWEVPADDEGRLRDLFDAFAPLAAKTRFIGEVGLDFSPRCFGAEDAQTRLFREIAGVCAREGGKVVSIHAVQSASAVLDILEETRCCSRNTCVFHWFSGTSDELKRASDLGCCFSFGPRSLGSRRGRAYAGSLPLGQLLLETDAPDAPQPTLEPVPVTAEFVAGPLSFALTELCASRSEYSDTVTATVRNTSARLLSL